MGYPMGNGARLILVTVWSSTILFYGPILAIAVLITVCVFVHDATGSKPRPTTLQKRPRRYASVTRTTASRMTVNQWREAEKANGSAHSMEGR